MHPIERLRHVARATGADPAVLAREAAGALVSFRGDPAGLVTACRRLLDRHIEVGPLWWLAARVLVADDPSAEAWASAQALDEDTTARQLAADLPADTTVVVLGWPDVAASGLGRRGDIEVLVVDAGGYGRSFSSRLQALDVPAVEVPEGGLGPAVAEAGLVLLEATALGPDGLVAPTGSYAAAALARHVGIPVWAVAGVGRVLPGRLWEALTARLADGRDESWDRAVEVVPGDVVDVVVGPEATVPFAEAFRRADCPVTPELLKTL